MRQRVLAYSIAAVAAVSTIVLMIGDGASAPESADHRAAGGAYDNPSSRREWEARRLRDPATGRIPPGIWRAEKEFAATLPQRNAGLYKRSGLQDYGWTSVGPANIGGRTRALAVDMRGEDTILAGGVSGGMWRSTDAGRTWKRVTPSNTLPAVSCITQDPREGKRHIFYYGTGEILGSSASKPGAYYGGDGFFKSTDGGVTWTQRLAANTPHVFDQVYDYIWKLVVDPSNRVQDELYMAAYGGIMRSTNGGVNWSGTTVMNTTTASAMCDVAVAPDGVVYATLSSEGARRGIWRSADGLTWKNILPDSFPRSYRRIVIGIAPSNPSVVYFLAETPGSGKPGLNFKGDTSWSGLWKYTYLSGDGSGAGGVWENRTMNLPSFGGSFGDYNPQFSYDMHIEAKPDDENVLFIGGTNVYRSLDAFATSSRSAWIGGYRNVQIDSAVRLELEYPNHHPDQHGLVFSRTNPNVVYTASDGGVHRTDDVMAPTVSWTSLNNSYVTTQFYAVAIDPATPGDRTIVGGMQDNGTWLSPNADPTAPWNWIGSGDGSFCTIADGRTSLYVSKQEGRAYRVLLNNDGTLKEFTRIDPLGGKDYMFISPFALDPSDQRIMYLTAGNELWRNSDLTAIPMGSTSRATVNWSRLEAARVDSGVDISAVGVSHMSPAHRVYFGTSTGKVYRMDAANEGAPARTDVTGASFPRNGYVNCVAVDPANGDRAVVVFSNYSVQSVFLTTDAGATWTPISGNLEANANATGPGPSCRWFTFLHRGGGTVYLVGTSTGLYSTTSLNGSSTMWALEGPKTIGNVVVDMIAARASDGFVAVGTHGNGVYTATIAPMGAGEDAEVARLRLEAPTPNPASTVVRLRFSVPAGTAGARLALYDVAGRELARLHDGPLTAGDHGITLDLFGSAHAALPAGAYYLRLEAGGLSATQALRIVR